MKNTNHGNEVLLQDTTHLIQIPCYRWVSPCQDLACSRTTRRPRNHRKEMQHVSSSSGLAKTILQGTGERGKKTKQRKRWGDNIREWTGLEFAKSQKAVESREKLRKLVVKSSVVPQRPVWWKDRWRRRRRRRRRRRKRRRRPTCSRKIRFAQTAHK